MKHLDLARDLYYRMIEKDAEIMACVGLYAFWCKLYDPLYALADEIWRDSL